MKMKPTYVVKHRRRREGKTNYRKRLKLLLSGKPRFVVRKTNKYIICQYVVSKEGQDRVLKQVNSKALAKYGWKGSFKNLPAAYLTGYLLGKLVGKKEAILDMGLYPSTKGSRIYAALKGALDAGMKIPHDEEVLPPEDRIKGKHINEEVVKLFEEVKGRLK